MISASCAAAQISGDVKKKKKHNNKKIINKSKHDLIEACLKKITKYVCGKFSIPRGNNLPPLERWVLCISGNGDIFPFAVPV